MSTGHHHATKLDPQEAKKRYTAALLNPAIRKRIYDSKFRVDRGYDIPYLAGYSKDGKVVYVDRHLPLSLSIGGNKIAILPFLIVHERVEKALIDFLDLKYLPAHQIATYVEHRDLMQRHVKPALYEAALDPYIKADQHEKIERVPRDLDMTPYRDSRDLKLLAHMQKRMVA